MIQNDWIFNVAKLGIMLGGAFRKDFNANNF